MPSTFARNTTSSALAGLATSLSGLISSLVMARILGVDGYGAVAFGLWVIAVSSAVAELGLGGTLSRFVPEMTGRGEEAFAGSLFRLLLGPLLCGALAALFGFVCFAGWQALSGGGRATGTFWLLCGFGCFFQTLGVFGMGYMRGLQRFDYVARIGLASLLVEILAVTFGSMFFGQTGALAASCMALMVPAVATIRLPQGSNLPCELRRRVTRYAVFAWGAGLASVLVWSRIEIVFLERSLGLAAVGLFTVGVTLSGIAAKGPLLLTGGFLAFFSESSGRDDQARIRDAYATGTRILAFLVFPACLGCAALVPVLVPMLYGAPFVAAVPAACIMVAATALVAASAVGAQLVSGMGRSDFVFASAVVGAILSLASGLLVVPHWGLLGAAVARAVIQVLMVAAGICFIGRLGCPTPFADLARMLLAAALCGSAAYGVIMLMPSAAGLPAAIVAGMIVYGLAIRVLRPLPEQDVAQLVGLAGRLPFRIGRVAGQLIQLVTGRRLP